MDAVAILGEMKLEELDVEVERLTKQLRATKALRNVVATINGVDVSANGNGAPSTRADRTKLRKYLEHKGQTTQSVLESDTGISGARLKKALEHADFQVDRRGNVALKG